QRHDHTTHSAHSLPRSFYGFHSTTYLLTFAAHLVIPVHERTVWVVPPGPDVQFEMCWQAVTIRAVNELERLSLKYRRSAVTRQPGGGNDNELHADQSQTASRRFVYQHFGPRGIQQAVADQGTVHVVKAHGSMIRATDTAKERLVTGSGGRIHVGEL